MKYLKNFETDPQYQLYIGGGEAILPNISYVKDDNQIYYNPEPGPLERALSFLREKGYTEPDPEASLQSVVCEYADHPYGSAMLLARARTATTSAVCVFVINGNTAANASTQRVDDHLIFASWEPFEVGNPQLIRCNDANETWYIDVTESEINTLIGERIIEI